MLKLGATLLVVLAVSCVGCPGTTTSSSCAAVKFRNIANSWCERVHSCDDKNDGRYGVIGTSAMDCKGRLDMVTFVQTLFAAVGGAAGEATLETKCSLRLSSCLDFILLSQCVDLKPAGLLGEHGYCSAAVLSGAAPARPPLTVCSDQGAPSSCTP